MRRAIIAALCLVVLSACASQELIKKSAEYGIAHEVIKTQYGEFWVYENPDGKHLAVSAGMGGAVAQGLVKGLTFGAGNILPSRGAYQEAARAYLDKHKAIKGCKITDGYLLQSPIYEFVIACPHK